MKVAAIIAEYNPFHKGHLYHIEKTKELTDCNYLMVIMSGNYTQRGEPAIFNKYFRTEQALLNGADVVMELPSLFSTASAEGFSFGAVSLIHKLGVCDYLSFGSESCQKESFEKLSAFLSQEPDEYKQLLKLYLKKGYTYPKSRSLALESFLPEISGCSLEGSNNILALEYHKALLHFKSSIEPIVIQRVHNNYHDPTLADKGKFSSATAIRNSMEEMFSSCIQFDNPSDTLEATLPDSFFSFKDKKETPLLPLFPKDFSLVLQYKLFFETPQSLIEYVDINLELAMRIYHNRNQYKDIESFCRLIKTKDLTYTRVSRCLLHILLNIRKDDYDYYKDKDYCPYGRILGFRKSATPLLHKMKECSLIPLITKTSKASFLLSEKDFTFFERECRASHIYESVAANKYQCSFQNEYTKTPVII